MLGSVWRNSDYTQATSTRRNRRREHQPNTGTLAPLEAEPGWDSAWGLSISHEIGFTLEMENRVYDRYNPLPAGASASQVQTQSHSQPTLSLFPPSTGLSLFGAAPPALAPADKDDKSMESSHLEELLRTVEQEVELDEHKDE